MPCAKFQFFPWCGFTDTDVQSFSVFPIWLPHHVTDDVIIINKTFHMSSRTNGENVISIWQAVAEQNTKVQCGQTNGPKCKTLSFGESKNTIPNVPWRYIGLPRWFHWQGVQSWMGRHSDAGYPEWLLPQYTGTHFADLGRMTVWVNTTWYYFNSQAGFELRILGSQAHHPNHNQA